MQVKAALVETENRTDTLRCAKRTTFYFVAAMADNRCKPPVVAGNRLLLLGAHRRA